MDFTVLQFVPPFLRAATPPGNNTCFFSLLLALIVASHCAKPTTPQRAVAPHRRYRGKARRAGGPEGRRNERRYEVAEQEVGGCKERRYEVAKTGRCEKRHPARHDKRRQSKRGGGFAQIGARRQETARNPAPFSCRVLALSLWCPAFSYRAVLALSRFLPSLGFLAVERVLPSSAKGKPTPPSSCPLHTTPS
jgi:hypothetical protein